MNQSLKADTLVSSQSLRLSARYTLPTTNFKIRAEIRFFRKGVEGLDQRLNVR